MNVRNVYEGGGRLCACSRPWVDQLLAKNQRRGFGQCSEAEKFHVLNSQYFKVIKKKVKVNISRHQQLYCITVKIAQLYGLCCWRHWSRQGACLWFSHIIPLSITLELLLVLAASNSFGNCKGMTFIWLSEHSIFRTSFASVSDVELSLSPT